MNHLKNQIYGSVGILVLAALLVLVILFKEGFWA